MKTILRNIYVELFQLTGSDSKSAVLNLQPNKLKKTHLRQVSKSNPIKQCYDRLRKIMLKRNKPKYIIHLAFLICYSVFILFTSNIYLSTTVQAAPIVETFKELLPIYHKEFKSDIYEVWVKPIYRNQPFIELDGVPERNVPFNPVLKGFEESFTYKSVNDIASNDYDSHSKCYQYFYDHPNPPTDKDGVLTDPIQYRSESISDDPDNEYSEKCDSTGGDPDSTRPEYYKRAYDVMTHSNNWTTFDVGHDAVGSYLGAVRIYIQINSGHNPENREIEYDIRPNHYVETEDMGHTLGNEYKYIKVRAFGGEYVMEGVKTKFKKVLVLDVLQPFGTEWSGQFNVSFNNAKVIDDIKSPYPPIPEFEADENFKHHGKFINEELNKHPLFIFANPLPKWYHNLANKSNYNGCPETQTAQDLDELGLPNHFYTHSSWVPGHVVETATYLDADGILLDQREPSGTRKVHDLILKSYSKKLCIPGGVYVKGRIIHNNQYHTDQGLKLKLGDRDLSPGDSGEYDKSERKFNNAKGVKIVGRGILSGIHAKHRTKSKTVKNEECNECPCKEHPTGGGWFGHLIDIRHRGDAFTYIDQDGNKAVYTDTVKDEDGNDADCYSRSKFLPNGDANPGGDVNCIQGITLVDAPKASIYTGGKRMDVENVKIMSWHIQSNGIGSGVGSKIKNLFLKVNDDSIVMGKSHMNVDNVTVWRQRWGSVVNLSWNLPGYSKYKFLDPIVNSKLNGLNVIRFGPVPQEVLKGSTTANGNAAIVSARNLMGGTISGYTFKNIIVEDPPYQILNLQLDDTNAYKSTRRNLFQDQLDGTGKIDGITFDGLFTKAPQKIEPDYSALGSNEVEAIGEATLSIQKSVFSVSDEMYDENYATKCDAECDEECDADSIAECKKKCDYLDNHSSSNPTANERSISGIKLNNICINEGNPEIVGDLDIKGITTSILPSEWEVNIEKYFTFKEGVNPNLLDKNDPEAVENYIPFTGIPSTFNGINGSSVANRAEICASLMTEVNMCTIGNLRYFRDLGLCPASN